MVNLKYKEADLNILDSYKHSIENCVLYVLSMH